jgi:trehalose utilization protein
MAEKIRVTVWGENAHEKVTAETQELYPDGMHTYIANFLNTAADIEASTAVLDEPEHGLTEEVLDNTDVITWWGHIAHGDVDDAIVQRVYERVMSGMGIICLHSAHFSKIFTKLMGTTCNLKWREVAEREVLWVTRPGHEILQGIDDHFIIDHVEMYGELFDIPEPDETILISSFEGGEVFRSGCTWRRGAGKVFYFRPGHETYPVFYNEDVQRVITNGVRWAKPVGKTVSSCSNREMGWFLKK